MRSHISSGRLGLMFLLENSTEDSGSGRQIDDKDMVHVMDYADYIRNKKIFMDKIVMPSAGFRK